LTLLSAVAFLHFFNFITQKSMSVEEVNIHLNGSVEWKGHSHLFNTWKQQSSSLNACVVPISPLHCTTTTPQYWTLKQCLKTRFSHAVIKLLSKLVSLPTQNLFLVTKKIAPIRKFWKAQNHFKTNYKKTEAHTVNLQNKSMTWQIPGQHLISW